MTVEQVYNLIDGEMTFPSIYMDMIHRLPDNSVFVEVGAYKGKSLSFFILEMHRQHKTFNIYAVDNFVGVEKRVDKDLRNTFNTGMMPLASEFTLLDMDSVSASKTFQDKSIDFVFIDGAHDYDSVRKDILAWYPKLKTRGVMAGHDYKTKVNIDVFLAVTSVFNKDILSDYFHEYCWAHVKYT